MATRKKKQARVSTHPVRRLSASDQKLVERVRRLCMKLPEANERVSHGEPTWFAGKGKVFAMIDGHHHDSPHLSVWLPQPLGAQEALIDADPERFFRPPYVGVSGWVGVVLDGVGGCAAVALAHALESDRGHLSLPDLARGCCGSASGRGGRRSRPARR